MTLTYEAIGTKPKQYVITRKHDLMGGVFALVMSQEEMIYAAARFERWATEIRQYEAEQRKRKYEAK